MEDYILIILTVIVIFAVPVIGYILTSKNLQSFKIKLEEAETLLNSLFKEKYDLLNSTKEIITKKTDIDHKVFSNLKKIINQNLSVYEFDNKLTESHQLIEQIIEDFSEIASNKEIIEINDNISILNEKLEATKVFYNKYAQMLNTSLKKQPSKLIAKFVHINSKTYFKV